MPHEITEAELCSFASDVQKFPTLGTTSAMLPAAGSLSVPQPW